MESITFDFAPGAIWSCKNQFAAPIGKDTTGKTRHFIVNSGTRIKVRADLGLDRVLIEPQEKPTNFSSGSLWMDTVIVSRNWLSDHFYFTSNPNHRLYRLTAGTTTPYSMFGNIDTVLDDDQALLDAAYAHAKGIGGLTCHIYRNYGYANREMVGLWNLFDMLSLLKSAKICSGDTDEWAGPINFQNLLYAWAGLIVVNNGIDFTALTGQYPRYVTTMAFGQHTIFLVETDDEFFHSKMSMKGPLFLHKERTTAAL